MIKKVLLFLCALGLTPTLQAHASPTNKKITLTCSSVSPDVIIGQVDVTVYDSTGQLSYPCTNLLSCDSSGTGQVIPGASATNSASCTPGFRVQSMSYTLYYSDFDYSTNPPTAIGSSTVTGAGIILKGPAFSTQVGPNSNDTVTLDVK